MKQHSQKKQKPSPILQRHRKEFRVWRVRKQNLEQYLQDLDSQYNTLTQNIEELTVKAGEKSEELKKVQEELEEAKAKEKEQYENMKLRIAYMYENGQNSLLDILCQSTSFADFLNRADNVSKVAEYDRNMLAEYEETKQTINEHEDTIAKEMEEIQQLRTETSDKRQEVRDLVSSTNSNIEEYVLQISNSQEEANQLLAEVSSQDGEISSLMAQAQAEEEAAAKAQEEAAAQQAAAEESAETVSDTTESADTSESETESTEESAVAEETPTEEETTDSSSSDTSTDVIVEEVTEEESQDTAASGQGTYLGNFTLTAYCNCAQCCGTAGNQTASGTWPQAGRTVAMAGVPFGTQLLINGTVYTVEDLGTPYGHVDIYFNSHAEALAFGLQHADVYRLN